VERERERGLQFIRAITVSWCAWPKDLATTEDDIDILDEGERTKSRFGSEVLAMRATPIRQTPIAFTLVPRIVGIDGVEWLR
jgi:hypothetical protein